MKLGHALVVAVLGTWFVSSAQAALFDFSFTFSNRSLSDPGGTVTGIVRGLTDNATSAASSVEITGNTGGFGLGEYVGNPDFNSWTVAGGVITDYFFVGFGAANTAPDVTCCILALDSSSGNGTALHNDPGFGSYTFDPKSITFTRLQTAVPEPEMSWLLGVAAVGIGASVRRGRRSGAQVSRI